MTWHFETDPEFQKQLDWIDEFVQEEIEPLQAELTIKHFEKHFQIFKTIERIILKETKKDGDADDEGASDGGEDLASASDDDEAEKKRNEQKRELRARASSWPRK